MTLDRIAQAVLVVFGALILILLVMGLLVSCQGLSFAGPVGTATVPSGSMALPGFVVGQPLPTPRVGGPAASPTPSVTATVAAAVQPATTPAAPGYVIGSTVTHVVTRGEWLLQIARCYGISYATLYGANPVAYPDYILPGLQLTVPNIGSQGAITGAPCVIAYTVVAGDTWESLAQRFGTTTAILQRANPGALSVGRSIWVPRVS